MTNRRIKIALRFLEILMQCLFFITLNIIFSFLALKYNVAEYNRCLMISVLVIASYIFRRCIDRFFTFYFMHALLFVAAIFYSRTSNECFFYILQAGILFAFSTNIKMTTIKISEEKMPMVGISSMVACYFIGIWINNEVMIQSGLLILVLFTMAEIIYNNLNKINNVFIDNKENVDFPANQLFKVNMHMLTTSLIFVLLGMMAFYKGPFGNIFQIIGRFFNWIICLILKLLLHKAPLKIKEVETIATIKETKERATEGYYASNDSGSFGQLFYTLLVMFAIFITIVLIIKIVTEFKNFAKKKKLGSDLLEFINPKKIAKNKIKISRANILGEESELDHNLKLRKIYKKRVKKGIGHEKIPFNAFPEEITRKGISEDTNDIKIVTDIYEKARYSNEKVNAEEMDIMKNINKQ